LVLLLAVVAALAAGWRPLLARLVLAVLGDEGFVAQVLAAKLRAGEPGLGPVDASGSQVSLLGGRVRVLVRREAGAENAPVHFVATLADGGPGVLEARILGFGNGRIEALGSAIEAFRTWALPPIVALAHADPASKVAPFGGTERWGVPGFRGFAGPMMWRGGAPPTEDEDEALREADLFAGLSLPEDDRPHLLKAVLAAKDGAWRRSLELDGVATPVTGRTWAGSPAPPGSAEIVRFAAFRKRDHRELSDRRAEGLRRVVAGEGAALAQGECPLARLPARFNHVGFTPGLCSGGRLLDCAEECDAGSGSACYHAAVEVESDVAAKRHALTLFLRACRAGNASGCTNAAATLDAAGKPATAECTARTYEAVCERAGDPWSCAMFGRALIEGRGIARDAQAAHPILEKTCREDPEGRACEAARGMLERLDASRGRE
jgi:hypothetical protein